jgi:hypothetical protein
MTTMMTISAMDRIRKVRKINEALELLSWKTKRFLLHGSNALWCMCLHTLKLPRSCSSVSSQLVCVQRFTLCCALNKNRFGSFLVGQHEIINLRSRIVMPSGVHNGVRHLLGTLPPYKSSEQIVECWLIHANIT